MEFLEERLARGIQASSRRQILRFIGKQEKTVKEIATATQTSVSLASRHLSFLHDLGFLQARKKSTQKFYSLKSSTLHTFLEKYDELVKKLAGEEQLARALHAVSRRQILSLLAEKRATVKEIAEKMRQSVSLTSRHLTLLHDLELLRAEKISTQKFYSLKHHSLKSLLELYEEVIQHL